MIIKTKKYQLPKNVYVKTSLIALLKRQWWYILGPIAFGCLGIAFPEYKWWFGSIALAVAVGYVLFWAIQFYGVTQVEQNKIMFEKLSYEIDSRQILIKLNAKQGSPLKWDMIKKANKNKDHFLLEISRGQIIHLPFKIFNSDNDVKFMEAILKRKEYIH